MEHADLVHVACEEGKVKDEASLRGLSKWAFGGTIYKSGKKE